MRQQQIKLSGAHSQAAWYPVIAIDAEHQLVVANVNGKPLTFAFAGAELAPVWEEERRPVPLAMPLYDRMGRLVVALLIGSYRIDQYIRADGSIEWASDAGPLTTQPESPGG